MITSHLLVVLATAETTQTSTSAEHWLYGLDSTVPAKGSPVTAEGRRQTFEHDAIACLVADGGACAPSLDRVASALEAWLPADDQQHAAVGAALAGQLALSGEASAADHVLWHGVALAALSVPDVEGLDVLLAPTPAGCVEQAQQLAREVGDSAATLGVFQACVASYPVARTDDVGLVAELIDDRLPMLDRAIESAGPEGQARLFAARARLLHLGGRDTDAAAARDAAVTAVFLGDLGSTRSAHEALVGTLLAQELDRLIEAEAYDDALTFAGAALRLVAGQANEEDAVTLGVSHQDLDGAAPLGADHTAQLLVQRSLAAWNAAVAVGEAGEALPGARRSVEHYLSRARRDVGAALDQAAVVAAEPELMSSHAPAGWAWTEEQLAELGMRFGESIDEASQAVAGRVEAELSAVQAARAAVEGREALVEPVFVGPRTRGEVVADVASGMVPSVEALVASGNDDVDELLGYTQRLLDGLASPDLQCGTGAGGRAYQGLVQLQAQLLTSVGAGLAADHRLREAQERGCPVQVGAAPEGGLPPLVRLSQADAGRLADRMPELSLEATHDVADRSASTLAFGAWVLDRCVLRDARAEGWCEERGEQLELLLPVPAGRYSVVVDDQRFEVTVGGDYLPAKWEL